MLGKVASPILYTVTLLLVSAPLALTGFLMLWVWQHAPTVTILLMFALAPVIYICSMICIAAVINIPVQRAIISGIFPRDLNTPLYFGRRVYGICLSTIMYSTTIYNLILTIPLLKKFFFRSFGLQGNCNFTAYTDTWIRDIKLLSLGNRAYLANQSTLGTNICLTDGNILVGRIKIGDDTQLGRLCVLGPGTRLGQNCSTGVRTIFGIRTVLKDAVEVGGCTSVSHGVLLYSNVIVREYCYLGSKCEVHEKVIVPAGTNLEAGTIILSQDDLDAYSQRQHQDIHKTILERLKIFNQPIEQTNYNDGNNSTYEVLRDIS